MCYCVCSPGVQMMEDLLRDHLVVPCSSQLLLSEHQYGLRKGSSCALQLIDFIDKWTKAIDEAARQYRCGLF